MNPGSPDRVNRCAVHPVSRHRNPRRRCGTPTRRAEAMPRPTDTTTRETAMTTTTDWRDHDDRDNHQDRLATELAADTGTW